MGREGRALAKEKRVAEEGKMGEGKNGRKKRK